MIDAICDHFRVRSLRNVPYLHRYLGDASLVQVEAVLGFQLTAVPRHEV